MLTLKFSTPEAMPAYDESVHVRLTRDQKKLVESVAIQLGIPTSTMTRMILLQAMDQIITKERLSITSDPEK